MKYLYSIILLFVFSITAAQQNSESDVSADNSGIYQALQTVRNRLTKETGVYVLEYGEHFLMGRAWLAAHAERTIDIQYFIWSSDNIGKLAAEALVDAADRGVKVRVIVDDLLMDTVSDSLLALASHKNIQIRIYNPTNTVGVHNLEKIKNVITDFRQMNQRMHDKTALFDGVVGITGGRNMADEYYDLNQQYNFRDRDILVVGAAVNDMENSFEQFWQSEMTESVEMILKWEKRHLKQQRISEIIEKLHAYADDPKNFEPEVRQAIFQMPESVKFFIRMVRLVYFDA